MEATVEIGLNRSDYSDEDFEGASKEPLTEIECVELVEDKLENQTIIITTSHANTENSINLFSIKDNEAQKGENDQIAVEVNNNNNNNNNNDDDDAIDESEKSENEEMITVSAYDLKLAQEILAQLERTNEEYALKLQSKKSKIKSLKDKIRWSETEGSLSGLERVLGERAKKLEIEKEELVRGLSLAENETAEWKKAQRLTEEKRVKVTEERNSIEQKLLDSEKKCQQLQTLIDKGKKELVSQSKKNEELESEIETCHADKRKSEEEWITVEESLKKALSQLQQKEAELKKIGNANFDLETEVQEWKIKTGLKTPSEFVIPSFVGNNSNSNHHSEGSSHNLSLQSEILGTKKTFEEKEDRDYNSNSNNNNNLNINLADFRGKRSEFDLEVQNLSPRKSMTPRLELKEITAQYEQKLLSSIEEANSLTKKIDELQSLNKTMNRSNFVFVQRTLSVVVVVCAVLLGFVLFTPDYCIEYY